MFRSYSFISRRLSIFKLSPFRRIHNSWLNKSINGPLLKDKVNKLNLEGSSGSDQDIDLKLLNNICSKINFGKITTGEAKLLLQCCGTSSVNSTHEERDQMCKNVFENLVKHDKLNPDIYLTYIQICTENRTLLNSQIFLENLKFRPDYNIYKSLLENVCECGDLSQAFIVLENMRQDNITVDESIFNCLVLVHTLKGGIEAGEKVLETMKTAQVSGSNETYIALLKGIIRNRNYSDFQKYLDTYEFVLDGIQTLNILKELGLNQNVDWISKIKTLVPDLVHTRDFIVNLKRVCIYLIYSKKFDSAIKLYAYFQPQPEENYGFFILEEMCHSNADSDEIISTAKYFFDKHNNDRVFENLLEFAFKHNYFEFSWKLLNNLSELRPHFFWPLILNAQNNEGEGGVLKAIEKIHKMGLKLDSETLEQYVIPFCDLDDMVSVVEKLKKVGFTVREILSPMLLVLLRNNSVKNAAQLCEFYNVQIGGEKLFKEICFCWRHTKDLEVVSVLQKFCETNNLENDLVGEFLITSLNHCKSVRDYKAFSLLLQAIHKKKLTITTTSADTLRNNVQQGKFKSDNILSDEVISGIDEILEFKLKTEMNYIPHPRDMKLDELECHLIELKEKKLNTRGVLRRLILMHSSLGNVERVEELRQQFVDSGYEESLSMKTSLMFTFAQLGNLEMALDSYEEVRKLDPKFPIDHYKVIGLATVLVKNDRIAEAMKILEETAGLRAFTGSSIQKNCVELLNSYKDENEQSSMLHFLVSKKFCKFNNIMLGPLVRLHLKRGDLEKATNTFREIVDKFQCTPLQFELIRETAKTKNEELLQKVLEGCAKIHGPLSAQSNLICALAEIGEEKILKKILATTKFQIREEINKKCIRWIKEEKSEALITLANSCNRLPMDLIDVNFVHECIMKTFAMKNDCDGAVRFYESLLEKELPIDKNLEHKLHILLTQNNYLIPDSLRIKIIK